MEEEKRTDKKQENKAVKTINIITKTLINTIYVILAIIVIILIYNLIQITVVGKPYMNLFGYSIFQVKTGSMSGTIEIGDIVIVKLTNEVEKNDIIILDSVALGKIQ